MKDELRIQRLTTALKKWKEWYVGLTQEQQDRLPNLKEVIGSITITKMAFKKEIDY